MPSRESPNLDVSDDPDHFDEALEAFRQRVPMSDDEFDTLLEDEKEFAFTVANVAEADIVTDVWEALESAIKNGTTLEEFKEQIGEKLEQAWGSADAGRIETIFRTNLAKAFTAGKYAVYSAPAIRRSRPYWRWEAIDDERIDDDCAELVDTVLPNDDPFWDKCFPPLHFNCRCDITALEEDEVDDEDIDDEAPDVEADDGFGAAPSEDGDDWEPDTSDYPSEIGDVLDDKLE